MTENNDIVPTKLAISALRDSGYNNSTYAIAELIDNAIQAESKNIEILFLDKEVFSNGRTRTHLDKVIIVDDGIGMDQNILRKSLQFGNGTRLESRKGIGRFGMGLPNSSISQCRRVDVYSWQKSDNVNTSFIDLDLVYKGDMDTIPKPKRTIIPDYVKTHSKYLKNNGTVIIWSNLDRFNWKRSKKIMEKTESLVGRLYRKFIDEKKITIRMAAFVDDAMKSEQYVRANDPGYLMSNTSTPKPYDADPMFEKFGEKWEDSEIVFHNNQKHTVKVRYSLVKKEVRDVETDAGNTLHGKHAGDNIGVSIVREGRELTLDQGLVSGSEPRERWWGIELEFPATLDEVFGLTNNKQVATRFSHVAKNLDVILHEPGKTEHQILKELEDDDDPDYLLVKIIKTVNKKHGLMMKAIKKMRENKGRENRRGSGVSKQDKAAHQRKKQGYESKTDKHDDDPPEQLRQATIDGYMDMGYDEKIAIEMADRPNNAEKKYVFGRGPISGTQFFDITRHKNKLFIKINDNHAAYKNLIDLVQDLPEEIDLETAKELLNRIYDGLVLLLSSWARLEDETDVQEQVQLIQNIRIDWGRMLQDYLKQNTE